RPLECARPARPLVERPEPALLVERVDLYDDAVDLVVELGAPHLPFAACGRDVLDRLEALRIGIRAEAALPEPAQRLRVRGQVVDPLAVPGSVHPDRKGTLGRDRRVLLAQRP